jgi:hypothetical protein
MSTVKLGATVYPQFATSSPTTGAAADADSTPTVTVEENGVAMGYSPTVANVATGLYRAQIDATTGNGFEVGKFYSVYVAVTVGGITGRESLGMFECVAASEQDNAATLALVLQFLRNKLVTDPATGIATLYADDSTTPLLTAQLYEGASTAQTYRGQGAERREKFA